MAFLELNKVAVVAEPQLLRILRHLGQTVSADTVSWRITDVSAIDLQEQLRIWDGANEKTAFPEISRNVFNHHPSFGGCLECVVHAELHRYVVVHADLAERLGQDTRKGFLRTSAGGSPRVIQVGHSR